MLLFPLSCLLLNVINNINTIKYFSSKCPPVCFWVFFLPLVFCLSSLKMWFGQDDFCCGFSNSALLTFFLFFFPFSLKLSSIPVFQGSAQVFLKSVILYKNAIFSWIFCSLLVYEQVTELLLFCSRLKEPFVKTTEI